MCSKLIKLGYTEINLNNWTYNKVFTNNPGIINFLKPKYDTTENPNNYLVIKGGYSYFINPFKETVESLRCFLEKKF